jgi:hypothetical protein
MSKPALIAAFLLILILRWVSQGTSQYAGVDDVKTAVAVDPSKMTLQQKLSAAVANDTSKTAVAAPLNRTEALRQRMAAAFVMNGKYNLGGTRYVRQMNRDYPGKDFGSGGPMSRAACGEWCNDNEDCRGFVRDLESQRCWIKKSMTNPPVVAKGKVSFIKM